jgi:hypothetical protein
VPEALLRDFVWLIVELTPTKASDSTFFFSSFCAYLMILHVQLYKKSYKVRKDLCMNTPVTN